MKPCWGRTAGGAGVRSLLVLAALLSGTLFLDAAPDKKSQVLEAERGLMSGPELLNAGSDPTLRYPVMHWYGSIWSVSYGWLDISRDTVRYEVQQPASKQDHGFTTSHAAVSKLKWQVPWLEFHAAGKGRHVVYLPPDRWGSVHTGPGMLSAGKQYLASTGSIVAALQNFQRALALVRPPPAPSPPPRVEKKPEPIVAPPPPEPPMIVLMEPSAGKSGEIVHVQSATLTVRGIATDSTGLPVVTINGVTANLKPRNAQAVEFWSDALPLSPGGNIIEIVASNPAKAQARFRFVAHYTAPAPPAAAPTPPQAAPPTAPSPPSNPKALAKSEIIDLLGSYVPSARVAELVRQYGLKFSPTEDDIQDIRKAGGDDGLIDAIRDVAKGRK
ncbi:MAG: hypothetical protein LAN62_11400 [Acidobacteriia bacterium]|nr:hypothetical protein [Terriglobia bacterium]